MFALIWVVVARTRLAFRRFMPTNVLLDAIHTRRGLKWGVPAMLLAVPYGLAALLSFELADGGAPGWLFLVGVLCIWNALKFVVAGPATLIRLARVRTQEARARRASAGRREGDEGPAPSLAAGGSAVDRASAELVR